MDAANLLKPALARGELRCIGATTLDEFREHIEKDPALERRFQPVFVGEPTVEDTIAILRGLKERYEVHHKVKIKDSALVDRGQARRRGTSPTASCPTRRSTWWTRPPAGWRWSSSRCRPRSTCSSAGCCSCSWPSGCSARGGRARPASGWPRSRRRSQQVEKQLQDLRGQWEMEKSGLGDIQKVRERLDAVEGRVQPGLGRDPPHAAARRAARREAVPGAGRARRRAQAAREADRRGRGAGRRPAQGGAAGCSRRRSTPRRSPRSSASGPASRSRGCSRPSARSC